MRFLVDSQLPLSLKAWLEEQGHQASHVRDFGLQRASDDEIWRLALELGAVVATKDRDFVEWATARRPAPRVLWLRLGNCDNPTLIARLQPVWRRVVLRLENGVCVVEVGHEG